jgi:Tfp pilus assembly PilM family ATPase
MFFARRRRTASPPVGVHVSAAGVRMVQLRSGRSARGTGFQPVHDLPLGAAPVSAQPSLEIAATVTSLKPFDLRRLLRAGGFAGTDVVAALPADRVHVRTFRLPAMPATDRDAAALRQAREGSPFGDSEPAHVDVLPAGSAGRGRDDRDEYISFAARDADVRALLDSFGGGVAVRSLRAEPLAIYRAAAWTDPVATRAVVHVGETETLVLVGEGAAPRVLRRVGVGAEHLDRAAARKLGVSAAEARRLRQRSAAPTGGADPVRGAVADATRGQLEEVAREAALCVRYHAVTFRADPPGCVRLLGLEAGGPQLRSLLHDATGLPVDTRSVFDGFAGDTPPDDGGWAAALGLALTFAPAIGCTPENSPCHAAS